MSEDIRHFTATIPAGIPATMRVFLPLVMPPRTVSRIDWKVPPGPMGTMSFLIAMAGVPVLPAYGANTYITADGKDGTWELSSYPDSGAWQCVGFNTGAFPHSVLLTFYCDLPVKVPELSRILSPYDLSPAPDLSQAGPPIRGR